jgi:hypothetical protein
MAATQRGYRGARADAESAAGLPTIRLGIDPYPQVCPRPTCRSRMLDSEEPLGQQQRGMVWCRTCSRTICWVAAPITIRRPDPVEVPVPAPVRRLIRGASFERLAGCGLTCTVEYGHDPETHERHGGDAAIGAIAARAVGAVATGPLLIEFRAGRCVVAGGETVLTATEWRILAYLGGRLDELCVLDEIVDAVWGTGWSVASRTARNCLRTHINRLRIRLGPARYLLQTARGRGYRLLDAPLC